MKEAGIPAESNKTETDDYIEFHVRIPKSPQQPKRRRRVKLLKTAYAVLTYSPLFITWNSLP